jgi:hypothetical protein
MGDKKETKEHFVDVGRAETDIYVPDPEVAEVFESDKHGHGARTGGREMMREIEDQHGFDRDLLAGDPDANIEDATFVGEEAPGGGHAVPDQTIVDNIGEAMGLQYQDNEPLHTTEKVEDRDRHRWELDAASAEDYQRRSRDRSGE